MDVMVDKELRIDSAFGRLQKSLKKSNMNLLLVNEGAPMKRLKQKKTFLFWSQTSLGQDPFGHRLDSKEALFLSWP